MNTPFLPTHLYGDITSAKQAQDFIHEHVVKAHALVRVLLTLHHLQRISASTLYDYLWTVDEQIGFALSQSVADSFIRTQQSAESQSTYSDHEIYKSLARANVLLGKLLTQHNFFEVSTLQLLQHLHKLGEELEITLFYTDDIPGDVHVHERKPSH